ncbi:MAG: deoxyribose-phosphate aldolase [candidate division WOR-3 bacterium]|nr:MAG: deoxyribose-phosphate aldolase [candidate division WOR-3 bacterium]
MDTLNRVIDQTILRPDATSADIMKFMKDVAEYQFYAAVVNPCWVPTVVRMQPEETKICSVVGFPFGASTTRTKVYAAEDLIKNGCNEIDMVMNIGRLKEKDFKYIGKEIKMVSQVCAGMILKVIIETCLLTRDEKVTAANIITESGAHFVKTSTGYSHEGAQLDDVVLLRSVVGPDFGVKASGGIRTYEQARNFISAGANRLGTSSGVSIVQEAVRKKTSGQ